ncbi:MAG TPA: ABC transporter permease subunit [Thermoanaerobaculia bacterium]
MNTRRFWTRAGDRAAGFAIRAGGLLMVGSLVLIFGLIFSESLPLFRSPSLAATRTLGASAAGPALAAGLNEYLDGAEAVLPEGVVRVVDLETKALRKSVPIDGLEGRRVTAAARTLKDEWALGLSDGSVLAASTRWQSSFESGKRTVDFAFEPHAFFKLDPAGRPAKRLAVWRRGSGGFLIAASPEPGSLALGVGSDDGPRVVDLSSSLKDDRVSALAFLDDGGILCVGTEGGRVVAFSLAEPEAPVRQESVALAASDSAPVTAMEALIGGQSLIAGDARGRVAGLLRIRENEGSETRVLKVARRFEPMPAAVTALSVSPRGKTFLAGDASGRVTAYFATNQRTLASASAGGPVHALATAPKGDGVLAITDAGLAEFALDAPHPAISWRALFGKVLYEGYDQPEYTWQSTGGTDDFESKMSLTPLIFGTLKGTLYALLFAVPVALAAAFYTAAFATPAVKRLVKPVVEVMAGLPSVVLGFLAGLWLAPVIQRSTLATLLLFPLIPLFVLAGVLAIQALPPRLHQRLHGGRELLVIVPLALAAVWFSGLAGPLIENVAFHGDFKAWLLSSAGLKYDARNSLVIAFAMGFAVIPIIFTISEDALSSVPEHLRAASLALGASEWQTAVRVILPTASAGIFSAVMIGFGRAVGETMIVLMATGNTPVMEWSIFNGMRTLSANIAVEISEAPFGGTLYRVLFLAALLLFVITFVVNTLAEALRQRLRRKYTVI